MKKLSFLFLLVVGIAMIQSCQKESIDDNNQAAPQIPSQETFLMPFNGFENVDTLQASSNPNSRSVTFKNWFFAGTNILVWNTALVVTMAVPVASFAEAFNHDPSYEGNGVYAWTYRFPVAGVQHTAKLTGEFVNGGADVQWVMTISKSGSYSDVVFYTGVVAVNQTRGTWTLNHRPENPEPFIRINYQRDASTGNASIRYTDITPGSANNGNYLEHRTSPNDDLNRGYDVFDSSEDNLIEIQWNEPSSEGRVRNAKHFGDDEWHCWDTEKMDIDC